MVLIQSNNIEYDEKAEMQDQGTMKAKKDKKGKKRKAEGGDEVKNDGVAASEDSPAAKRTKKFSMKLYHEHMKKNPITALMELVSACDAGESDRRDVVGRFLSGGGKPGEVVQLLHSAGDSEEALVFPVFSALKHLLTCYMVVERAHQESLEKASWQVLSAHSTVVQQALAATRRADTCKAVLTVLAAMVTISPKLGKEVLTRVSFTPKLAAALAKPTPAGNTSSVRTCFVQLLVAFLVTDDASVIGQLCNRKDLLASVVPDLVGDPADTVMLLVTSLRYRLVESKAVHKSVKMTVFKTATLHGLLALYRWVGPRARDPPDTEVDEETRQRVALAAHGLLLVLCTSHRLGVLFPCKGKSPASGRHNKLVATLFQKLDEPWQHELQWELALKTLVACPHLVHGFLPRLRDSLRPANSLRWHRACAFYQQLVESLDPEPCAQSDDVLRAVVTLAAPPAVLGAVGGQSLLHGRLSVRHRLATLLCSVLRATERLLACAEARRPGDAPALRSQVAAHLVQHLPGGSTLARAWALALAAPEDGEDGEDAVRVPSPQEHLAALLDLLEACGRTCPPLLSGAALEPRALLADVQALCADGRLVAKALAVLFSLDPAGFSQDTELLRTAVGLLLGLAAGTDPDATRPMLLELLGRTGLFAADGHEPRAWLRCYLDARPEARPAAARLLADALALVAGDPRPCRGALAGLTPARRLDAVFRELLDGVDAPTDETLAHSFSLSPLLPGVLQLAEGSSDTDPEVVAFISRAVVHLLHSQASADVVWHLLKGREHLVLPAVLKYVRGWLSDSVPKPLRKPFGRNSLERRLSRCLLRPDEVSVEHVFGDALSPTSDNQDAQVTDKALETLPVKDPYHAMLLLRLSLFHVGQLIDRGELSEQTCANYQRSTSRLLGILRALPATPSERDKLVGDYFKCAVSHPTFLEALAPGGERLVAGLFTRTVEAAAKTVPRQELAPLRRRLLLQARAWLAGGRASCPELLRVLGLFQFEVKEAAGVLRQAAASRTELLWLRDDPARLSPVGLLLALLLKKVFQQPCRGALEGGAVLHGVVEGVARHVVSLQDARLVDVSQLEGGFLQFLRKYPHYLEHVPEELLRGLLGNPERSDTAAKLCVLLVERSAQLAAVFSGLALERTHVLESATCVFAVLSAALAHGAGSVDAVLLRRVYERYRGPICRAVVRFEDVPAWVTSHVDTIVALIDTCMGVETCRELCALAAEKGAVRDTAHQRLLHAVFARSSREGGEGALAAWCGVLLGAATAACQDETAPRRLDKLVLGLRRSAALAGTRGLAAVREGERWWEFARLALARGMKGSPQLLGALAELCGVLYEDGSDHPHATELFNVLAVHPNFLPSVMGTVVRKRPVLELWLALTKKAPAVMSSAHVPTLLGAYGASLSLTDQLVLALLRQYEGSGVSLEGCRPYLWGHAAVAHYGVRSPLAAALRQQPSVAQVLDLLSEDKVTSTLQRFPLDRPLHVEGRPHGDLPHAYDPAFFLPLLSHLLAPENVVRVSKVHSSGALALCIAALSSDHRAVRQAACHALARFYCHAEASWQRKEKQLWLHVVDALRNGAASGPEVPQLPSVVTVYLALATRHISNPSSPLGTALHNYVCLRPALRLDDVPDFLRLFHSRDVHHREHRRFILELLQHGIRREADFHLAHDAFVYKMLMTFYSSVLADDSCKVLILQVLQSTAQLPAAAAVLVSSHGLLSWLDGVVARLERRHARAGYAVLRLLCRLWASLAARPGSAAGPLLRLLLRVPSSLQPELPARTLAAYTAALSGAAAARPSGSLARDDVAAVLRYCRPALGPLADLHALLAFGGRFARYEPCRAATTKKGFARSHLIRAHLHLRSFVLSWLERTPHPD